MSNIQVFNHSEFGDVRTVQINGETYFVGIDIARVLEYAKPQKAVRDHCDDALTWEVTDSLGRKQETRIIPKGDVYRLLVKAANQSKNPAIKEKAKNFERWIFDEVLVSIDKHGAYLTPQKIEEVLLNPDTIIQLATQLKNEREKVALLAPKADYCDDVLKSQGLWTAMVI